MTLSVVITTRNEADNIANCIRAFDGVRDCVEIIVVDNSSTDDTKRIAADLGAVVLDKGPERSAQRNLGWRTAKADWVIVLDADMILPKETIAGVLEVVGGGEDERRKDKRRETRDVNAFRTGDENAGLVSRVSRPLAYWIPEVRTGTGLRTKARNFERSFYDGTCIDALRLFHRSVLEATGGYDENLIAGPEDWELDIRVLATGAKCAVLEHHLIHNEKKLSLKRMLEKKAYYTKSMAAYQAKWKGHPALKKQFGLGYRYFGVFVEHGKWKKLLRHPVLAFVMYLERILVGFTYLINR